MSTATKTDSSTLSRLWRSQGGTSNLSRKRSSALLQGPLSSQHFKCSLTPMLNGPPIVDETLV